MALLRDFPASADMCSSWLPTERWFYKKSHFRLGGSVAGWIFLLVAYVPALDLARYPD